MTTQGADAHARTVYGFVFPSGNGKSAPESGHCHVALALVHNSGCENGILTCEKPARLVQNLGRSQ